MNIPKIQKSKDPKIQKSKNPIIQKSKNPKIGLLRFSVRDSECSLFPMIGFLDFWIFGFLEYSLLFSKGNSQNPKIQTSKNPNIQRSQNPKSQSIPKSKNPIIGESDSGTLSERPLKGPYSK